jgi:DNA gyrase subunit A
MAGIRLAANASVVHFGVIDSTAPEGEPSPAVLVTIAGSSAALPGTDSGSGKVTVFTEYPAKGRATAGVRCHRFLKGEDRLLLAWVGPAPARATTTAGSPVGLPAATGRRDGSGTPMPAPVHAVG